MAWIERSDLRKQKGKSYQDNVDPSKHVWDGTVAPLHFEGTLDSGFYDAEIDMTPVRIDSAIFDGWRITQNGWHYALGKDLENHGDEDGWIGFGGRQGAHWFKFRLLRVGYLRWSDRDWWDIGGTPEYLRSRLNQTTHQWESTVNGEQITVASEAAWERIWATPGGGQVDIRWKADGSRLKEEIALNQAGREWIAANRNPLDHWPEATLDDCYFGFVFRLDWSDIPKVFRAGVLQDVENDFADDGESIELTDALDRLLAVLPLDCVTVPNDDIHLVERQPIRKRFWKNGDGNHYLLVGVRCDLLNGMPAGDLIFDPTVEYEIDATADDGTSEFGVGRDWWDDDFTSAYVGDYNDDNIGIWARFTATIPAGATIDANTYLSYYVVTTNADANALVGAEDAANPANPTDYDEYDADVNNVTTATVSWDGDALANGQYNDSPSIQSVIQELQNSYDYSGGSPILMLWYENGSPGTNDRIQLNDFDSTVSRPPKLHIEYTVAGTTSTSTTTTTTVSSSTSTTQTASSSTSQTQSTSTTTTLNPATGGLAFGEQNPLAGETPVSWQTWSDGAAGIPTVIGDQDWGKIQLTVPQQGRSRVYDFGDGVQRTITVTEDRYEAGQEDATLQIRGQAGAFNQDDGEPPNWENYVAPVAKTWRYIQVRAYNQS